MDKKRFQERIEKIRMELLYKISSGQTVYNVNEAALYTGFSKSTIYKLTSKRQIPHFCPNGKNIYFLKEQLDSYLVRNYVPCQEELEKEAVAQPANRIKIFPINNKNKIK